MPIIHSALRVQSKQQKNTQSIFFTLHKHINKHSPQWWHTLCAICFFSVLVFANNQALAASTNNISEQKNSVTTQDNTTELPQVSLTDINAGQLLFTHSVNKKHLQAPTLENNVDITIQGVVANAKVTQTFQNTTQQWQHAMYVFPLPDNAAINSLKITLDDREIIGVVKEKQAAKHTFSKAKSAGKKAALLEQIRPNLFSMNIANIPPNERIKVELTYFQQVGIKQENGNSLFSLDYPMAITPRYMPDDYEESINEPAIPDLTYQQSMQANNALADENIQNTNKSNNNSHKVNFTLTLNSGAQIENIKSLYHSVILEKQAEHTFVINMPLEPLEKDFELQWSYKQNPIPKAVNFITEYEGDSYGVFMLFPGSTFETTDSKSHHQPRELTFILDTSGSMSGQSIKQAKRAIKQGLKTLKSTDYLQLITFNNKAKQLFNTPLLATKKNKKIVFQHVMSISANGGTDIKKALTIALPSNAQRTNEEIESERLEQIIFLTDGAVGNEAEIFTMINTNIHNKRLFTVGLGSAPNRYFMKRAAQVGRGTYHFIGNASELVPVMSRLFKQLSQPVLTNIALTLSNTNNQQRALAQVTTSPNPIPDLYTGEPIILSYKVSANNETKDTNINNINATLSANYRNNKWHHPFVFTPSTIDTTLQSQDEVTSQTQENIPALATLWAKRKIDDHYNALMLNRNPKDKETIIALALEFNLVSPFTSFIAVDTEVSKPVNKTAQNKQLINKLPAGQRLPQTALNWKKQLLSAVVFLLLALSMLILGNRYKAILMNKKRASCDDY